MAGQIRSARDSYHSLERLTVNHSSFCRTRTLKSYHPLASGSSFCSCSKPHPSYHGFFRLREKNGPGLPRSHLCRWMWWVRFWAASPPSLLLFTHKANEAALWGGGALGQREGADPWPSSSSQSSAPPQGWLLHCNSFFSTFATEQTELQVCTGK